MLFAVDIDNTIARDIKNVARRAHVLRELGLADDASARLYLDAPQNRERVQAVYDACEQSPDVMSALQPILGAQEALRELARHGDVIYVTCRVPALRDTTVEWLSAHGFPSPENARLCDSYHAKYLHAYEAAGLSPIVLIDDQAEKVARSFQSIARHHPDIALSLIPRMTVVSFNPSETRWRMAPPPFPVMVLKSWEPQYVARLIEKTVPVKA